MNYLDPTSIIATETAQSAKEGAVQAWQTTKEKAGEALQTGERYVRDNPGTSVLGVFSTGLLMGLLIGWSVGHENRDDHASGTRKFLKRWGHKINLQ